ncbi:MAG: hypothetical protein ACFFB5_06425 [Promethearchaeota archaeon]
MNNRYHANPRGGLRTESTPKECQYQVIDQQKSRTIYYCLVMREYLTRCPIKCPYFIKGTPIQMEQIYQQNYEIECPHLHLVTSIGLADEQWFVCAKTGEVPEPQNCRK